MTGNGNTDTDWLFSEDDQVFDTYIRSISNSSAEAHVGPISNYVVLTGFDSPDFTFTLFNGTLDQGFDGRARINGFQIVANAVPEPSSLFSMLLAVAGFAIWRRRLSFWSPRSNSQPAVGLPCRGRVPLSSRRTVPAACRS